MSYTVGDGTVTFALVAGVIGYLYIKHLGRQKRLEIIHQERMAAMEKGIPLPEFPLEPQRDTRQDQLVLPILGLVLFTLSIGTMIVLYLNLPAESSRFWITPLPFTFLGVGFIGFHYLKVNPWR
jgi:hypothetical protein